MGRRRKPKTYSLPQGRGTRRPDRGTATSGEWERLYEDETLRASFSDLARALALSQSKAEERARAASRPGDVGPYLDLRHATRLLDENPVLVRYLRAVSERDEAVQAALARTDLATYAGPTGVTSPQGAANDVNMGGWAGDKNKPIGVQNPRVLRDWADRSTWVAIAKGKLRRWCERADIAVVPYDEDRPYGRRQLRQIELLLRQPNEYRDSYRSLIGPVVEDILVLDRGVIEKQMTASRRPTALYYQDGAAIKIYPQWSGDPREPRYLYDPGSAAGKKVPLRNDEAIVMIENITSYRMGYSRVQYLQDVIQTDIKATLAAAHVVEQKPPPHAIHIPGATAIQLEQMRARYDAEFAGRKEMLFLGGPKDVSIKSLVYSLKDQQWLEWQVYCARKIATIFGIAPQEFGLTLDVNRATAEVQHTESENSGYLPLLLLLEEYWNRELLADFAPQLPGDRFDLDALNLAIVFPEVTEASRIMHVEKVIALSQIGLAGLPASTPNQLLVMRGEEPVKGGDTFYVKTATGAVPWLSYEDQGDASSLATGGALGSQTPDSGPDDAADGSGSGDTGAAQAPEEAPPSDGVGGTQAGYRPTRAPGLPQKNTQARAPGTRWSPALYAH